jgi:Uma2 family endonuclease
MASRPTAQLTEAVIEWAAIEKSGIYNGRMFATSGGSRNHSFLTISIFALLYEQKALWMPSIQFGPRIHIPTSRTYSYADCGIICGEPQFSSEEQDNLTNPLLIVEVLSPSTEDYDRGRKFELYRTIETFSEYLIIHQDKPHVEHYSRQEDKSCLLRDYNGKATTVSIPRLATQISLADLYSPAVF